MNRNEIKANTILALGDLSVLGIAAGTSLTFRYLLADVSETLAVVVAVIVAVFVIRVVGPVVNSGLRPAVDRANPAPKPAPDKTSA